MEKFKQKKDHMKFKNSENHIPWTKYGITGCKNKIKSTSTKAGFILIKDVLISEIFIILRPNEH